MSKDGLITLAINGAAPAMALAMVVFYAFGMTASLVVLGYVVMAIGVVSTLAILWLALNGLAEMVSEKIRG